MNSKNKLFSIKIIPFLICVFILLTLPFLIYGKKENNKNVLDYLKDWSKEILDIVFNFLKKVWYWLKEIFLKIFDWSKKVWENIINKEIEERKSKIKEEWEKEKEELIQKTTKDVFQKTKDLWENLQNRLKNNREIIQGE